MNKHAIKFLYGLGAGLSMFAGLPLINYTVPEVADWVVKFIQNPNPLQMGSILVLGIILILAHLKLEKK